MPSSQFFGRVLLPDASTVVNLTNNGTSYEKLVLANAALSIDSLKGSSSSANEITTLQIRIGLDSSTPFMTVCSLSMGGVKQWSLHNLQFDARTDLAVSFRVEGPGTIHITGHRVLSDGSTSLATLATTQATEVISKRPRSASVESSSAAKKSSKKAPSSATKKNKVEAVDDSIKAIVDDGAAADIESAVEEDNLEEEETKPKKGAKVEKQSKKAVVHFEKEEDEEEEEEEEESSKTKEEKELDALNAKKAKKANKRKRKAEAKAEASRAGGLGGDVTLKSDKFIGVGKKVEKPKALHKGGGLTVKDTIIGAGPQPSLGSMVKILYEGFLSDGTMFDSKQSKRSPLSFRLGLREVVPGFDKGVQGMKIGGTREIKVPASMGYGSKQTGPIPPNSDLLFKVELIG